MSAAEGFDEGIRLYVELLRAGGIETCQSCQGGPGHCYEVPTVDFLGDAAAGPQAVAVAFANGLPVAELRRVWELRHGEMNGPVWSITFRYDAAEHVRRNEENSARYFAAKKTGRVLVTTGGENG